MWKPYFCPPSVEYLFPPSPVEPCPLIYWPSKPNVLRLFFSCHTREPHMGSELYFMENPVIFSSSRVNTQCIRDLIVSSKYSSFHCIVASWFFNAKYLLIVPVIFMDGYLRSFDFCIFLRMSSDPSTLSSFPESRAAFIWMLAASFLSMCWPLS